MSATDEIDRHSPGRTRIVVLVLIAISILPVASPSHHSTVAGSRAAETGAATPAVPPSVDSQPSDITADPIEPSEPDVSLVNSDTVALLSSDSDIVLAPGDQRELTFAYSVTTPRAETAVRAELLHDDGSPALKWRAWIRTVHGNWLGGGHATAASDTESVAAGSSFSVSVLIEAPADAAPASVAYLHLGSTVTLDSAVVELGVANGAPLATFVVIPESPESEGGQGDSTAVELPGEIGGTGQAELAVPATPERAGPQMPAMTEADSAGDLIGVLHAVTTNASTVDGASALSCATPSASEVVPGEQVDLTCEYRATHQDHLPPVSAMLAEGSGWEVAIGESVTDGFVWTDRGERASWAPPPERNGESAELLVRLYAPLEAGPGERAVVVIDHGGGETDVIWTVIARDGNVLAPMNLSCSPYVTFAGSTPEWVAAYSNNERRIDGEITYAVSTDGPCGWSVTMSATAFEYSGAHDGVSLAPARLAFESSRLTDVTGVREGTVRGTFGSPVTLLVADSDTSDVTIEHTLALSVTLPGGTAPGVYRSTLTVTVTSNGDPGG